MATPQGNIAEYSVSELSGALKRSVEDQFGHIRVRGEISGFKRHTSGHCYFTLKDEKSNLDGVIWKGVAGRLDVRPEDGLEVIATGKITTYAARSKYQMVIEHLAPAGKGALMALLEERRKKLTAEGLFAQERKRPLPYLPQVIGVVTSPTGAVIRDILHRLSDRFPRHVIVWPVPVQGQGAAEKVAAAINGFSTLDPLGPLATPDILIVARGGGSLEDLWAFNEEIVVRAVAESKIPVITAVGHETDTTLVDFASDRRAPTPTAAAEIAVPVRADLVYTLDDLTGRRTRAMERMLLRGTERLAGLARGLPKPQEVLAQKEQRLDDLSARLAGAGQLRLTQANSRYSGIAERLSPNLITQRLAAIAERGAGLSGRLGQSLKTLLNQKHQRAQAANSRLRLAPIQRQATALGEDFGRIAPALERLFIAGLDSRMHKLDAASRLLTTLSYHGTLERGYALVKTADGKVVRSVGKVSPGMALDLEFADGQVSATAQGGKHPPKKPKGKARAPEQGNLF